MPSPRRLRASAPPRCPPPLCAGGHGRGTSFQLGRALGQWRHELQQPEREPIFRAAQIIREGRRASLSKGLALELEV
jgi:hypothetical protein